MTAQVDFVKLVARNRAGPCDALSVQAALQRAGLEVVPNGAWNDQTIRALSEFQRDNGLSADGILGPQAKVHLEKWGRIRAKTDPRPPVESPSPPPAQSDPTLDPGLESAREAPPDDPTGDVLGPPKPRGREIFSTTVSELPWDLRHHPGQPVVLVVGQDRTVRVNYAEPTQLELDPDSRLLDFSPDGSRELVGEPDLDEESELRVKEPKTGTSWTLGRRAASFGHVFASANVIAETPGETILLRILPPAPDGPREYPEYPLEPSPSVQPTVHPGAEITTRMWASHGGYLVVGRSDATVELYDLVEDPPDLVLSHRVAFPQGSGPLDFAVSASGGLLAVERGGSYHVFDADGTHVMTGDGGPVSNAVFHRNEEVVLFADDHGRVFTRDAAGVREPQLQVQLDGKVSSICWNHRVNGIVVGTSDGRIIGYELPEEDCGTAQVFAKVGADRPVDINDAGVPDVANGRAAVNAFAHTIISRDVQTPLSIGLFGGWGTGKSSFMESLEKRIETLAPIAGA